MSHSVERHNQKYTRQQTFPRSSEPAQTMGILDNYQIGKPIGEGAYAVVYVCYHKSTMKKYAIKIY
jgi:serine/threonine protein kinase